ncbi:Fibroleukin [Merluccius polli]|uniref:Fibroleukin n=1 Tax=Merluccius polli TaxID=89951 RepID=A0AA47MKW1_MERPO|nr:Fibroleukin [Merluccius polli]
MDISIPTPSPGDTNSGFAITPSSGDTNPRSKTTPSPGYSNSGHGTILVTSSGHTNLRHAIIPTLSQGHTDSRSKTIPSQEDTNPGPAIITNPGRTTPGPAIITIPSQGHNNPGDSHPSDRNPGLSNPGLAKPGPTNPSDTNPGQRHSNQGPTTAIPGHTHTLPLTALTPNPGRINLGPATQFTTPSTRELRVKINQVVAFPDASLGHQLVKPQNELMETTPPKISLKQGGKKPHSTDGRHPMLPSSKLPRGPRDCSDYLHRGHQSSGLHMVTPDPRYRPFPALCDMESHGGGWTVIQRRQDGSVSFNRTWAEYRDGFGEMSGGEFWLGNEKIHFLTRARDMVLRVELEDFEGVREHAEYGQFRVASERQRYRLSVGGYSGSAGDALRFSKHYDHHNRAFTTPDRDHDRYLSGNCGAYYSSGWWFDSCMAANLNGRYYVGKYKGVRDGIFWGTWYNISSEYYLTNDRLSFKTVTMMIRPKGTAL